MSAHLTACMSKCKPWAEECLTLLARRSDPTCRDALSRRTRPACRQSRRLAVSSLETAHGTILEKYCIHSCSSVNLDSRKNIYGMSDRQYVQTQRYIYKKNRASCTTRLARSRSPIIIKCKPNAWVSLCVQCKCKPKAWVGLSMSVGLINYYSGKLVMLTLA